MNTKAHKAEVKPEPKAEPKAGPKASDLETRVRLLEKKVAHIVRMTGVQGINELGDEGEEPPPPPSGGGPGSDENP